MEENELSAMALEAYDELKAMSAKTKEMVCQQEQGKRFQVMTKYLTDVGLTGIDVDKLPMIIDGITFDAIGEIYDIYPDLSPADVRVLTPCPECAADVWTTVPYGNLAGLGEVLQSDFWPKHECSMAPEEPEEEKHRPDDVVTWRSLTSMILRLRDEFPEVFGGQSNG